MQFYLAPRSAALGRRTTFGIPCGHPNSLRIPLARAVCAKVGARAPLNAKKRTFWGPRVPKGRPKGTQGVPKGRPNSAQGRPSAPKGCPRVPIGRPKGALGHPLGIPKIIWNENFQCFLTISHCQWTQPPGWGSPSNQKAQIWAALTPLRLPPKESIH